MKLPETQLDEPSLAKLGEEACRLFIAGDFQGLADKFGYALACNREIPAAIKADFESCFSCPSTQDSRVESVTVKYFRPNSAYFVSVIECVLLVDTDTRVLIELIAAKNGEETNLYLEDISAVGPPKDQLTGSAADC